MYTKRKAFDAARLQCGQSQVYEGHASSPYKATSFNYRRAASIAGRTKYLQTTISNNDIIMLNSEGRIVGFKEGRRMRIGNAHLIHK